MHAGHRPFQPNNPPAMQMAYMGLNGPSGGQGGAPMQQHANPAMHQQQPQVMMAVGAGMQQGMVQMMPMGQGMGGMPMQQGFMMQGGVPVQMVPVMMHPMQQQQQQQQHAMMMMQQQAHQGQLQYQLQYQQQGGGQHHQQQFYPNQPPPPPPPRT